MKAWTLRGTGGLQVDLMTYGGIVLRMLVPDAHGRVADVVLGFKALVPYLARHPYFGAVVGRVAGRISGASFTIDGETYNVSSNEQPNHLHGGFEGFDRKLWHARALRRSDDAPSVQLRTTSSHGEEGFPGNVEVAVTYTVTSDNALLIQTEATTDRATPLALTHHSYFNLGGEGSGSVEDHELQICADLYVKGDENFALHGPLLHVDHGPNDFREPRALGEAIPKLFRCHGEVYRVRQVADSKQSNVMIPAARLVHPSSGRVLEVWTTEPYLQMYTGVFLDGSLVGKSGRPYRAFAGLCLECQGFANGVNVPELGDIVLRPGERFQQTTAYKFSVRA